MKSEKNAMTAPGAASTTESFVMSAEAAAAEAHSRLAAKLPGFDPTVILGILTSILKALGVCSTQGPEAVKRAAEQGGLLTRLRLRAALRDQGLSPRDTTAAVQAALEIGASASKEEIAAFCSCCG